MLVVFRAALLAAIRLSLTFALLQAEIIPAAAQVPLSKTAKDLQGRLIQTGPTAAIIPPEQPVIQGNKATFVSKSSASSAASIARHQWAGPAGQRSTSHTFTVDTTRLSPGIYQIDLRVTDKRERSDDATAQLVVKAKARTDDVGVDTRAPIARISLRNRTVEQGVVVTFDGKRSTDPDGKIRLWSWKLDGRPLNNGLTTEINTSELTARDYIVQLEVTDEQNLKSTDSVILTVTPRKRPIDLALTDLQLRPDKLASKHAAEIRAIVTNHGEAPVENVMIRIQVGAARLPDRTIATLAPKQTRAIAVRWVAGAPGEYLVVATIDPDNRVDDQNKTNNRTTRAIQVLAPLAVRIYPISREVSQGERAKFTGEITSDPAKTRGEGTTFIWRGPKEPAAQNNAAEFDTKDIPPGKYTVTLQVTDENNQTAGAAATLLVKELPAALWISADREQTYTGQAVLFSGGAKNALPGVEYKFVFGDGQETDWLAGATIQHSYASTGDYKIRLLARRGANRFGEAATALRVIDIPYELALTTTAGAAYVGDPVTLTATIDPPAGDVEYQFRFGNGLQTDWMRSSKAEHAYTEAKTYVANAAARIGGKRIVESRAIDIPVSKAPMSPWLWVIFGSALAAAAAKYARRRFKKPALSVSIEPRINLDSVSATTEDNIDSSDSIHIRSVRGDSRQTIEPTQSLIGKPES